MAAVERVRTAKRAHPCDICVHPINAGSRYGTWTYRPGTNQWNPDHWHTVKAHYPYGSCLPGWVA